MDLPSLGAPSRERIAQVAVNDRRIDAPPDDEIPSR